MSLFMIFFLFFFYRSIHPVNLIYFSARLLHLLHLDSCLYQSLSLLFDFNCIHWLKSMDIVFHILYSFLVSEYNYTPLMAKKYSDMIQWQVINLLALCGLGFKRTWGTVSVAGTLSISELFNWEDFSRKKYLILNW